MAATRLTGRHISIEDEKMTQQTQHTCTNAVNPLGPIALCGACSENMAKTGNRFGMTSGAVAARFPMGDRVVHKSDVQRVGIVFGARYDVAAGAAGSWIYDIVFTLGHEEHLEHALDYAPITDVPESDIAFGERVATRIVSAPHIVKHDSPKLTAIGRDELITKINMLEASNNVLRGRLESELKERTEERDKARREAKTLNDAVTILQARGTELLATDRISRFLDGKPQLMARLLEVAWGIERARKLHPEGCSVLALVEEVGEVSRALAREDEDRLRSEIVDVAIVACRLLLGDLDERLAPREAHAARPR